jgi:hypothetical protein
MKNTFLSIGATAFIAALCAANLQAAETKNIPASIGVYDSRAVAFAWFSSGKHQSQLNELMQTARAAKTAGDTNRFEKLAATLREQQDQIHREGFSTAPPTEALAELKERLPEIQQAAGVTALVSKWDEVSLKQFKGAEQVDVTDRLVREFNPTDKSLKAISELEKSKPLPLKQCDELIRKNEI